MSFQNLNVIRFIMQGFMKNVVLRYVENKSKFFRGFFSYDYKSFILLFQFREEKVMVVWSFNVCLLNNYVLGIGMDSGGRVVCKDG